VPDAIFVIDTKKEHIAVTEARKLGLPVVAVVDTNCDPDVIDYVIPGNDDAIRAGALLCRLIADAVTEGRFIALSARTAPAVTVTPTVHCRRRVTHTHSRGELKVTITAKDVQNLRQALIRDSWSKVITAKDAKRCASTGQQRRSMEATPCSGCAYRASPRPRSALTVKPAKEPSRSCATATSPPLSNCAARLTSSRSPKSSSPWSTRSRPGSSPKAKSPSRTVQGKHRDAAHDTLKENISLGRVYRLEAGPDEVVETYIHNQAGRGVNAVAVVVKGAQQEVAHEIACTLPSRNRSISKREEVPQAEVDAERKTIEEISRNEGKPEAALPKIIEGRLNGWFKERVLLEQPYVKDEKQPWRSSWGATISAFAK
jgi:hypothetical protein